MQDQKIEKRGYRFRKETLEKKEEAKMLKVVKPKKVRSPHRKGPTYYNYLRLYGLEELEDREDFEKYYKVYTAKKSGLYSYIKYQDLSDEEEKKLNEYFHSLKLEELAHFTSASAMKKISL